MQIDVTDVVVSNGARIKVVGVGGGGSNTVNYLVEKSPYKEIGWIVANTDAQALKTSPAQTKIQLGAQLTKGLGAGMRPDVGREAALESIDEIREILKDSDIVFIAAGLGGGTGTGAAPVIAKVAKEIGALTISVVTKPFKFEARKRSMFAEQGLLELKKESNSIVVIPNDKLLMLADPKLGMRDSFDIVNNVLARAVNGISGMILRHEENDINVDFADLRTVMNHHGLALMGIGESSGGKAAYEAVKNAIESPLFDNMSINGAMGVLVYFQMHPDYPIVQIGEAMEIVYEATDNVQDADVIFGVTYDESMERDAVKVTMVATGFEKEGGATTTVSESSNSDFNLVASKDLTQPKQAPNATVTLAKRKVGSGDFEQSDDILDIPTFMRRGMD